MSLSSLSIQRPVFAWILMVGLIFFGGIAFTQMGINENPDVDFPVVTVQYAYEGASPVVIEKDIIEPVENVLVSIEGIRNLTSTAERGQARITLEFELSRDIDFALQEVQTLVGRAQRQLPATVEPATVTKSNADDDPIVIVALRSGELSMREVMLLFRDKIRDQFSTIEGVAEVRPFGYHDPVLRIDLDPQKLIRYQLTGQDIIDSIQREHRELPAGKLEYKDEEDLIRVMGEAVTVEDFKNMVISRRGSSPNYLPLRLSDVAEVYEGIENLRRISRINGESALGFAIQKQRGVNAAATADRVIEKISVLNKDLPKGAELVVNFDRTQFIRESVNELVFTLVLSAILTSLVCWLFLGTFSATSNILLAIPTSIIGAFIFMYLFGFTLNTFSLLGLALAIGVVVDDAIIMLENIVRYMQMGYDRVNAAFKGSREITFAVLATTLALVSIFIPIVFIPGIEGRFFFEFAVTLSVAVALSSVEALTLAPMRCSQFLTTSVRTSGFGRWFEGVIDALRNGYRSALTKVLEWPKTASAVALVIFGLSLIPLKFIDSEFAPAQDRSVLFLIFIAPNGKSMEYTDQRVREFEKLAQSHPAVERIFVAIGGFGEGGQGNRGNGVVILKDPKERDLNQFQVAEELRNQSKGIEGLKIIIRDRFGSAIGGRRGSPIEFTITGPDPKIQEETYNKMQEAMEASKLTVGVRSDDVNKLPEVQIVPNRKRALELGVEIAEVARIINVNFGGAVAGQYTSGSQRFDIFVQLKEESRQELNDLNKIFVRNNRGELIALTEVVEILETETPQYVYREDRVRGVRVDGNLAPGAVQSKAIQMIKEKAKEVVPAGYAINFSESLEDKGLESILIMALGLILAYMVLASQFNSFFDPFIVFLAVPFGITGALIALFLSGQTLNAYSVIGILLTMGIVKKNSILLVEFTNQLREEGRNVKEALIEAGPIRLRPIIMTTMATVAAAIPAALSFGPGSETRVPMAVTVIGGITFSLLLTLFVVPAVYSLTAPKRREILVEDEGAADSPIKSDDSHSSRAPFSEGPETSTS